MTILKIRNINFILNKTNYLFMRQIFFITVDIKDVEEL